MARLRVAGRRARTAFALYALTVFVGLATAIAAAPGKGA